MIKEIILFALAFLSEFASVLTFIVCTARVGCLHSCILADGFVSPWKNRISFMSEVWMASFSACEGFLFVISQKLMLLTIWSYSAVWEAHLCREINDAPDEATSNLGGGQQWQKIVQTDNQLGSLRIEGLLVSHLGELLQVWNQSARLHHIPLDQKFIDMQVSPHSVDFRIIRLSSLAYILEYIHWLACTWQTAGHWIQREILVNGWLFYA